MAPIHNIECTDLNRIFLTVMKLCSMCLLRGLFPSINPVFLADDVCCKKKLWVLFGASFLTPCIFERVADVISALP